MTLRESIAANATEPNRLRYLAETDQLSANLRAKLGDADSEFVKSLLALLSNPPEAAMIPPGVWGLVSTLALVQLGEVILSLCDEAEAAK